MLARPDSSGIPRPSAASAAFPAWARAVHAPESEAEAGFLAGAALARLDLIVRENPPWAGVWRQRLALAAAAASVRRAGRSEDEAALRDALHLTRSGADPGPAGRRLLAWRALAAGSARQWRSAIVVAAAALGLPGDETLQHAIEAAEACAAGARPAPFAAARTFALASRALAPGGRGDGAGESELLAAWLADSVLAQKLKWPFAPPLLAAPLFASAGRRAPTDSDGAETTRILFAWAKGAAQACDLAAELRRRAQKLAEAAPKLRAKGAKAALQALRDQDSLAAATPIAGLSQRGARRLFERLATLGAIRELTGRATFRLYGL
jgi:uncharacterized protein DUF1403